MHLDFFKYNLLGTTIFALVMVAASFFALKQFVDGKKDIAYSTGLGFFPRQRPNNYCFGSKLDRLLLYKK